MDCGSCGAPGRRLRCPPKPGKSARFEPLVPGERLELQRCASCGAFWSRKQHESGGLRSWALWPDDESAWNVVRAQPAGEAVLGEWHDAVLRESWLDLAGKERAVVERWRERTHREHNPIDRREPPRFLARSDELTRVLEEARSSRAA
jgi:hypothetical protein